jgi:hypothetical protein
VGVLDSFKTDTLHPVATLVIPGTVAIAPYLLLAVRENEFAFSLFVALPGILVLNAVSRIAAWWAIVVLCLVLFTIAVYQIFEAFQSARLLARLRRELLAGITVIGGKQTA